MARTNEWNKIVFIPSADVEQFNEDAREHILTKFGPRVIEIPTSQLTRGLHSGCLLIDDPLISHFPHPADVAAVFVAAGDATAVAIRSGGVDLSSARPALFIIASEQSAPKLTVPPDRYRSSAVITLNELSKLSLTSWADSLKPDREVSDIQIPLDISITFDPQLTADQVLATLTALADYYRACGGVGLPADFESQEAVVEEDIHV